MKLCFSCHAENKNSPLKLKRQVNFVGAVSLIVGTIIGSGIFISPKGVFENSGSIGLGLIVSEICCYYLFWFKTILLMYSKAFKDFGISYFYSTCFKVLCSRPCAI